MDNATTPQKTDTKRDPIELGELDDPKTTLLSRRKALSAGAAAGLAAWQLPKLLFSGAGDAVAATISNSATAAAAQCVLTKELTEGPYWIDDNISRRDVTEGIKGMPLILRLKIQDASSCEPIEGADVEIWHADPAGEYSGFDGGQGGTTKTRYLRGHQKSAANGIATFTTIFPGWYSGRAPHIHVKVHIGGKVIHTGQVFFKTAIEKKIYAKSPYNKNTGSRVQNSGDNIYKQIGSNGLAKLRRRSGARGYIGTITLGVES